MLKNFSQFCPNNKNVVHIMHEIIQTQYKSNKVTENFNIVNQVNNLKDFPRPRKIDQNINSDRIFTRERCSKTVNSTVGESGVRGYSQLICDFCQKSIVTKMI
jgi:hypothetical protein